MPDTIPATIAVTECDHDAFLEEESVARESGVELRIGQSRTRAELIDACRDADGVLVQYAHVDGEVMDALPRLRAIGRYGVGVDSIDIDAATARGIAVCNVPDYGTEAVSDHAIGLTLAVARGIPRTDRGLREGRVDLPAVRPLFQTRGRTFGVVGLGRIGAATARKAAGLGYAVIGHDSLVEPGTDHHGVPAVTLDELCARADVVSLHVPLTPQTRGLIGAEQFALMRDTTIVVNTARGGVVDVPALVDALEAGRLGGAGIDTHEDEPLPVDHPLTRFDNVVLTPHLAWYTEESYGELKRRTIENVVEVLAGRNPRNIVNPRALGVGRTALTHAAQHDPQHDTAGGLR
ncbi:C-terminal binding protein [Promicromonospora sp. NPDC060271]|uniref:C-terminal binding protein n=1 Tax=Promicromonospora sp. NPDC060271 TaxID=3347089 RepID=UPI003658131A